MFAGKTVMGALAQRRLLRRPMLRRRDMGNCNAAPREEHDVIDGDTARISRALDADVARVAKTFEPPISLEVQSEETDAQVSTCHVPPLQHMAHPPQQQYVTGSWP